MRAGRGLLTGINAWGDVIDSASSHLPHTPLLFRRLPTLTMLTQRPRPLYGTTACNLGAFIGYWVENGLCSEDCVQSLDLCMGSNSLSSLR